MSSDFSTSSWSWIEGFVFLVVEGFLGLMLLVVVNVFFRVVVGVLFCCASLCCCGKDVSLVPWFGVVLWSCD